MAAGFNKSSRSRKIPGGGTSAGQMPPIGPGKIGMKRMGMDSDMMLGRGGKPGKGMKGMKGMKPC